ncbi:ankyrin repeat domain-containing protein [Paenibacillus macquariensis]|uniref:Ankyrin repeat-containing protein n=1 Tax=Paenibacillus macquariensis TaxID=948756 RepID=A0ABY1JV18_9BACL|nr:ankyrin repeat domain-containing protein [Paenibacillus macquariensis]MEC0090844.1 ankyrin repeat domain-containing protein [Paenibacillus macquariensis]OAB34582.1 hypothetical protein PMSM_12020 [Paenibacillus macquariensis subsp. macquariensis]SIQ82304.1 Ankyrin repeat-containing protein [Paenibacillus macquariensis]
MIKIKDIGDFKKVPQIVTDIIDGNLSALEEYFKKNNIDKEIKIGSSIDLTPLDVALIMESLESVKWLAEHGANLNIKDNPSFLIAVRYCNEKTIRFLVANGAKTDLLNNVKSDAFKQALIGKKFEHLELIHELGHKVEKYGGEAFRSAVWGHQSLQSGVVPSDPKTRSYKVLDFFISHGVDINYNKPDQVFPYKPTPLCVAARYMDMHMVRYLVEHGADVTIAEKDGMRPYSIAVEKDDLEMAEYFKALEPVEFHSIQNKMDELKPYKLPQSLFDFLQGEQLHIELQDCDFGFIDFFSLIETVPMKFERQKLLRISKITGDYDHISLVWNPKSKKIAYYDMEHQELGNMCSFEDFIKEPAVHMEKILNGDYGE